MTVTTPPASRRPTCVVYLLAPLVLLTTEFALMALWVGPSFAAAAGLSRARLGPRLG